MVNTLMQLRARQTLRAPKMCFIHVPKCGGAAVSRALAQSYSYLQRLLVPDWYVSLGASREAADLIGSEMMDLRETVLIYKLAERRVKFITGHIVCRPKTRSKFEQEWRFVTVLRDPVKRWVSEFVYNTYGTQEWAKNELPIEQYLESPLGSATARRYIEYFSDWRPGAGIDERHVHNAVANLDGFAAVGTLDALPEFTAKLQDIIRRRVSMAKLNVSPRGDVTQELMRRKDLIDRVRDLCRWDIAVYENFKAGRQQQAVSSGQAQQPEKN